MSGKGVAVVGSLSPSPLTLARLGGRDLGRLFVAQGGVIGRGAADRRCRTQVLVTLDHGVHELLQRPLGNHQILVPGRWAGVLESFRQLYLDERESRDA